MHPPSTPPPLLPSPHYSYITKLIECPPIDGEPSYEKPTNLWIGLYRGCAEDPKIFQWVGGVDLSDELKNWEEGQPDNFFSKTQNFLLINCF